MSEMHDHSSPPGEQEKTGANNKEKENLHGKRTAEKLAVKSSLTRTNPEIKKAD